MELKWVIVQEVITVPGTMGVLSTPGSTFTSIYV